jgi:uncharacterized protein (UPF0332 family)
MAQAEETIDEAERLFAERFSPRIIINRAYYAMFYAVLALFLKTGIQIGSSKHKGVLTLFDKEFVKTGKIDKKFSAAIHETFDKRLAQDYRDLAPTDMDDARESVELSRAFVEAIKGYTP